MFNIGPQELLLILVVALLVVGPRRLPELARSLGKGIRELRKAQDEVTKTIQVNLNDERGVPPRARSAETAPAAQRDEQEPPVHPTAPPSEVQEISRTLGRGLAELRRAREEIQRGFRVELDDRKPAAPERSPRRPGDADLPTGDGTTE
ncbi:MAG TPA: twin-arginine translocase TatA/TatE family subunit [Actinomycetota bacterium]|jgi:sec-independent protein translocase protein TatA|nr:twin-arginine translocase TatA/TatE family subunit [Actinomycetota bacterium]